MLIDVNNYVFLSYVSPFIEHVALYFNQIEAQYDVQEYFFGSFQTPTLVVNPLHVSCCGPTRHSSE